MFTQSMKHTAATAGSGLESHLLWHNVPGHTSGQWASVPHCILQLKSATASATHVTVASFDIEQSHGAHRAVPEHTVSMSTSLSATDEAAGIDEATGASVDDGPESGIIEVTAEVEG